MRSGNAALEIEEKASERPAAVLRGSARGLEIVVDGRATVETVIATATARLAEAPAFFKGSDVRIQVEDGPLPPGSLGRLDELATSFDLRIIEIGAVKRDKKVAVADASAGTAIPKPNLAAGSAPNAPSFAPPPPNDVVMATARALAGALADPRLPEAMASSAAGLVWVSPPGTEPLQPALPFPQIPAVEAPAPVPAPIEPAVDAPTQDQLELALKTLGEDFPTETRFERAKTAQQFERAKTERNERSLERAKTEPGFARTVERGLDDAPEIELVSEPETRLFVGPVRSGVILDHRGHLFVFGDVNPGAEVRATGNIVVLGRMRGTAHAGIGAPAGFILALRLEPQQLRIGRMVARASDGETATHPEIAYVTDSAIVVERYQGRLPNGLASTLAS